MDNTKPHKWNENLTDGIHLFRDMIICFKELIYDDIIKHFAIRGDYSDNNESEQIIKECGKSIQKCLIEWINNEKESGDIFERSNWKPYRDGCCCSDIIIVYNKKFIYKQWYFYLSFDRYCEIGSNTCNDCIDGKYSYNFNIVMYGIRNEHGEIDTYDYKNQGGLPSTLIS